MLDFDGAYPLKAYASYQGCSRQAVVQERNRSTAPRRRDRLRTRTVRLQVGVVEEKIDLAADEEEHDHGSTELPRAGTRRLSGKRRKPQA